MKEYALTDLVRRTAEVRSAATREPVVITEHSSKRFVFMSYDDFISLKARTADPRTVLDVTTLDPSAKAELLLALEDSILFEDR